MLCGDNQARRLLHTVLPLPHIPSLLLSSVVLISMTGQTQSVDHCGNSGFSSGTSMCTCSGAALSANPCGLTNGINGINGTNGTNGSNGSANGSSNGTSGGGGSKVVSAAALAAPQITSATHAGFLILTVLGGTMLL